MDCSWSNQLITTPTSNKRQDIDHLANGKTEKHCVCKLCLYVLLISCVHVLILKQRQQKDCEWSYNPPSAPHLVSFNIIMWPSSYFHQGKYHNRAQENEFTSMLFGDTKKQIQRTPHTWSRSCQDETLRVCGRIYGQFVSPSCHWMAVTDFFYVIID